MGLCGSIGWTWQDKRRSGCGRRVDDEVGPSQNREDHETAALRSSRAQRTRAARHCGFGGGGGLVPAREAHPERKKHVVGSLGAAIPKVLCRCVYCRRSSTWWGCILEMKPCLMQACTACTYLLYMCMRVCLHWIGTTPSEHTAACGGRRRGRGRTRTETEPWVSGLDARAGQYLTQIDCSEVIVVVYCTRRQQAYRVPTKHGEEDQWNKWKVRQGSKPCIEAALA